MLVSLDDLSGKYAFLDPASGKKARTQQLKNTRARSAIVIIGVDSRNRIFVLDCWADRVSPSLIIDKAIAMNAKWRPKMFGVEANAQQYLFAEALNTEARRKGANLPWVPVGQPTNLMKDDRIRNILQPAMESGRLFVQDAHIELLNEIRGFPNARTKDIIDALASAIGMAPPPKIRRQSTEEIDELAAYLRRQGLPPSYIEERIDQVRREYGFPPS